MLLVRREGVDDTLDGIRRADGMQGREDKVSSLGCGYGCGSGTVDGKGYGNGNGSGSSCGSGTSNGNGSGYGYGAGHGYGVKAVDGLPVYRIDDVPTLITHVAHGFATGYILRSDLTRQRCYVVKGGGCFAHGATLREAREDLQEKLFDVMPEEDRIAAFWACHNRTDRYCGRDLYDWHHKLTGSCEMGRDAFVSDRGLDIDAMYTVADFIRLCENDFGGSTIRKLKE